jgi:predicted Rossmann fold flavoprotein
MLSSSSVDQAYNAIILGAGAAGLMCAIEAGKREKRILVIEHADRIGKKILISGGGRCNFTNLHAGADNFISHNPHFAKSALARYGPDAFIRLVEKHRIPYHEKKLGQLFCDRSAQDIITMLKEECRSAGVEIRLNTCIHEVRKDSDFTLRSADSILSAPRLVVATGGLSIPKIGASSLGYDLALQFGLKIQPPRPALVPFVFNESDRQHWCDLAGVSTAVSASVQSSKAHFREKMLFTHRGLSGPAILQISSYWNGKEPVCVDLAPGVDLHSLFRARDHRDLASWKLLVREVLPRRLADRWLEIYPPQGSSVAAFADAERALHTWQIHPAGTEGYAKAEVTAGGVDTDELHARSMETRKVPGLYFIGEVVDVTGQLGGFNFQWAWASGFCAGQAL